MYVLPKNINSGKIHSFGDDSLRALANSQSVVSLSPSAWVQAMVKIPKANIEEALESGTDTIGIGDYLDDEVLDGIVAREQTTQGTGYEDTLEPFSLRGQMYMERAYDTPYRRRIYLCGRQVGKSTLGGNTILAYSCLKPNFRTLFVSPSETQTKRFSMFRIADPILFSPELRIYKGSVKGVSGSVNSTDNILSKRFVNGSTITLSYARTTADRIRGLSADSLYLDEIQDILADLLPVIRETLFTSPYKIEILSGTPKTIDNTANYYWEQRSTMNEWAVRCGGCSTWNVLGVKNVGKHYCICARCGHRLYPADKDNAKWISMRSDAWMRETDPRTRFDGYRVPQLISPFARWEDIIDKLENYPTAEFNNEVLGLASDSADKLFPNSMMQLLCDPAISLEDGRKFVDRGHTYMGIDWGTGESGSSFTLVSILVLLGNNVKYLYFRRFLGFESNEDVLIPEIARLVFQYQVRIVGADYGGGYDKAYALGKAIGVTKLLQYQYCNAKLLYYDKSLNRYMANRTELIMRYRNYIKTSGEVSFPAWQHVEHPFMEDFAAVFKETTSTGRVIVQKTPNTADDTLHSCIYALLASMVERPRPNYLVPDAPVGG